MTSSDVAAMIERLGKIRHNEIAREAAAMLAQLQKEREWQPIESAPRDKTMVVLLRVWEGVHSYGVGWYMPMTGWQGWSGDTEPTHWTPLPKAQP